MSRVGNVWHFVQKSRKCCLRTIFHQQGVYDASKLIQALSDRIYSRFLLVLSSDNSNTPPLQLIARRIT